MADLIGLDTGKLGRRAKALQDFLQERMVGQDRAIRRLVRALDYFDSGLKDSDQPICCFLLSGPSGVGKTFVAENLADFFFEDSNALTKVDCSNFENKGDINILLGSAPGFLGYHDPDDPYAESGTEAALSQFNIDKHDFFFQAKKSGKPQAAEIESELERLEEEYKIVFQTILEIGAEINQSAYRLNESAYEIRKRLEESQFRRKALELVEALLYLEKRHQRSGKKLSTEEAKIRVQKAALDEYRLHLSNELREHAEKIRKENPVVRELAKEVIELQMKILRLRKQAQNSLGYDPDNGYLAVILLDEVEKADQVLHNVLLEIIDKGRVRLRNGRITKFNRAFIILTSNIGADKISDILSRRGFGYLASRGHGETAEEADEKIYQSVMAETKKTFRSFFLGRLDDVIVFRPLTTGDLRKILELQISQLQASLAKNNFPIKLQMEEAVKEFIIAKAVKYVDQGARVIKKRVKKYLTVEIGKLKTNGELKKDDILHVRLEKQGKKKKVALYREPRAQEG